MEISWVLGFFYFSKWGYSGNEKFDLVSSYFDLVLFDVSYVEVWKNFVKWVFVFLPVLWMMFMTSGNQSHMKIKETRENIDAHYPFFQ